jgi:hypothetical protein
VPTNTATGLNEMVIDPDDVNVVYIVGDVYVADDMFVKVSRS